MDVVGGVKLEDGTECSVVTGLSTTTPGSASPPRWSPGPRHGPSATPGPRPCAGTGKVFTTIEAAQGGPFHASTA
jgi:hypothetical protein